MSESNATEKQFESDIEKFFLSPEEALCDVYRVLLRRCSFLLHSQIRIPHPASYTITVIVDSIKTHSLEEMSITLAFLIVF